MILFHMFQMTDLECILSLLLQKSQLSQLKTDEHDEESRPDHADLFEQIGVGFVSNITFHRLPILPPLVSQL